MASRLMNMSNTLALMGGLVVLTACGERGSGSSFHREAGSQIDSGAFGSATVQNMVAQTCATSGYGAGKVGAAPADPIVALDPASTVRSPIYRIHCDGRLDGKYAQVIYAEYVASATQKTVTDEAGTE